MGGMGLAHSISKGDPYRAKGCQFDSKCCIKDRGNCWTSRCIYKLECCVCGAVYTGTTGASIHKRSLEHMAAVRRGDHSNSMAKHMVTEHPEEDRTSDKLFVASVVDRDEKNLCRYIKAGLFIEEGVSNTQLNQRGEWGRVSTRRIAVKEN